MCFSNDFQQVFTFMQLELGVRLHNICVIFSSASCSLIGVIISLFYCYLFRRIFLIVTVIHISVSALSNRFHVGLQ